MGNPNIAIHSSSDVRHQMKQLESVWYKFVFEKCEPDHIRKHVYHSWKRCQTFGVNPHQKQTSIVLTDEQLIEWRNQSKLYRNALPIIEHLSFHIDGTHHLLTLCDNKGRIVYLSGENPILRRAEKMNFVIGADWSETSAGTNAIGTCIEANQPIQIFSYEHFCEGCHPWVCSAAPIRDPLNGQLLGVIDLTGPAGDAQPHSLGIAVMAARSIEDRLQWLTQRIHQHLQNRFLQAIEKWPNDPFIVLDETLQIVTATSSAISLFRAKEQEPFLTQTDMQYLKSMLLTLKEEQAEIILPETCLTIDVQVIQWERENIGFLLHFRKPSPQRTPKLPEQACDDWSGIIGRSHSLTQIIHKSQIVAPKNVPVLITGESGTGKELLARVIHQASLRHRMPFIAINCGAIPKELIASELFGYEAGAFTGGNPKGKAGKFEAAHGGTLFLDEIGEMPLDLQVFLLRVLQEKEIVRLGSSKPIPIDVRIIAATNQNLEKLVQEGKFRADLYYRLNVVQLTLPPLRKRGDDLQQLCQHFIKQLSIQHDKKLTGIDKEALALLQRYHWPGNIRELKNVLEHAVLFAEGDQILLSDLPSYLQSGDTNKPISPLETEEKKLLKQMYMETNGNLSEMARRCNIARSTLYRKIKKYGIK